MPPGITPVHPQGAGCSSPSPSPPPPLLETRTRCPGTAAWLQGLCFGCGLSSVIGLASTALLLLGARAAGASCSPRYRWPYRHPAARPPTVPSCRLSCHPPLLPHLRAGKQEVLLEQCWLSYKAQKKVVKRSKSNPVHSDTAIFLSERVFNSPPFSIRGAFPSLAILGVARVWLITFALGSRAMPWDGFCKA